MKKYYIIILIVVMIVIVAGFVFLQNKQNPSTVSNKEGAQLAKAPNFSLRDYSGKNVSLSDFAGKPLVINSWAAWCPFCKKELPDFAIVQKEFGEELIIIAINRSESIGIAKGFTDEQGTSEGLIFLLDPTDSFYKSIGGFSMPETIFVDKDGNIVEHKRGPMDINEIRQKIQKIL